MLLKLEIKIFFIFLINKKRFNYKNKKKNFAFQVI